MNKELVDFAARLSDWMARSQTPAGVRLLADSFDTLARELFALQFRANPAYGRVCQARGVTPETVRHWTEIPSVPTAIFKELEMSCLAPAERTAVFHSSGTTEQKPSRHFHCAESLAVYEASLWQWFHPRFRLENEFIFLTPDAQAAPRSSLVHMFETVRRRRGGANRAKNEAGFFGRVEADGAWTVDFAAALAKLKSIGDAGRPVTVLGTAFSFVHLLDHLAAENRQFKLPAGSQVMETGGYKNRSRALPKAELHALITRGLGVGRADIICEYGMSELSSQAYDAPDERRFFHFPPWAKARIISPETNREAADGETGLIRILDLANVFSVAAVQTEDLGIRRGDGFELAGRARQAEPRGCSLMTA